MKENSLCSFGEIIFYCLMFAFSNEAIKVGTELCELFITYLYDYLCDFHVHNT